MGWILLEVLVALLLAVFIVWFTMGGKRPPPVAPDDAEAGRTSDDGKDTR